MRANAKDMTIETATEFAKCLTSGRFANAQEFLSKDVKGIYTPEALSSVYTDMISYGDGPAEVNGHFEFMSDWPARQPSDIGWAYISIVGDGFVEAVTVVVTEENGIPKIREIEWGRP